MKKHYENPLLEDLEVMTKAEKVGKKACKIILMLCVFLIILYLMLPWIYRSIDKNPIVISNQTIKIHNVDVTATINDKIEKYRKKHKVNPGVIEISESGNLTFVMDGKLCEIK
jgi:hypothetical protein